MKRHRREPRFLLWACPGCGSGMNSGSGYRFGSPCGACAAAVKPASKMCPDCRGLYALAPRSGCNSIYKHDLDDKLKWSLKEGQ